MLWNPSAVDHISDEEVEEYLDFACSSCIPGSGKNKEYALHQLQLVCGNIQEAILKLMQRNCYLPKGHPLVTYQYPETVEWTPDEVDLYNQALSKSEKDFFNIAKEVKTKSVKQCIEFYYVWKKVCPDEYKRLRTIRRKREQDNIFYSLRSKNEDGDSITPKSDSRSATPDKDIICDRFICEYPDCCASFISKQALNGHIRIHGGAASRGISPNRSPAGEHDQHVVVNGIALENESSNQVLDDYPCKICGKVFHKVKSRSAHMKSHRQTDDKKSKVHDVQVGVL
ncbi:TRERF1 (predicted) [Pycnogonum litorale]